MGVIFPLRSVRRVAMTVPSAAVTVMATSFSGILASLVYALTCMYPVADRNDPSFQGFPIILCGEDEKGAMYLPREAYKNSVATWIFSFSRSTRFLANAAT